MTLNKDSAKLDKNAFKVLSLDEPAPDRDYWWKKTPEERWSAMEYLRVFNYGEAATSAQLQRVLTVIEVAKR